MELQAKDLMTTDVETVNPDDEVSHVLTRLAQAHFTGFPVVEEPEAETETSSGYRARGELVGIVTQRDLVEIFQPSGRTLWIPVGLPPFLETVEYAIDLSWDELDTELDLAKHAGRPVSDIMTADVMTVGPDASLDDVLDILAADEDDINRVPVVEDGQLVGIVSRQDVLRAIREERRGS